MSSPTTTRRGTGKSHFIEALGHLAIDKGRTVAWHTPETLAQLLRRHRVDDSVNKAIGKLIRVDLVVIDDVGLLPISTDAAEALFRVVDAAYEKRSIAISSNIHPSGVRRADAQKPRDRDRRAAPPSRARPDHRRAGQLPTRASNRRQRGDAPDLTRPRPRWGDSMATVGTSDGHQRGETMATSGEFRGRQWGETDGH